MTFCFRQTTFFVQLTFSEFFAMQLRIYWTFQVFLEEFLEDARHIEANVFVENRHFAR